MYIHIMKTISEFIKLILLFFYDYLHRCEKFFKFVWYGKHEFERVCDCEVIDIYEKTITIDNWLSRTRCKPIRLFIRKNFSLLNDKTPEFNEAKAVRAVDDIINTFTGESSKRIRTRSMNNNISGNTKMKLNQNVNKYLVDNLEECDVMLTSLLKELTNELFYVILKAKHSIQTMTPKSKEYLRDVLYRIISYKMTILFAERLAATRYDATSSRHTEKLINLWNNLLRVEQESTDGASNRVFPEKFSHEICNRSDIVSNRWSYIGFQGEDPGTDFRGMGLLGLLQLEYISRKPRGLARDLLRRSLNENHSYPFAIVGINITYNLLSLFRDGSMKHLYFDTGDVIFRNKQLALELLKIFNDLYTELYLRFDCFWHESKPKTIFEFRDLMGKFVSIVKMDLSDRNFSFKFIY